MSRIMTINRPWAALAIPAFLMVVLCASAYQIAQTHSSNLLDFGIAFDLVIFIPLIYLLLIQKTSIPKTTIVPIMVLGFVVGTLLLPESRQGYLQMFKTYAIPVVELGVIAYIIYKVRRAIQVFRRHKKGAPDFYSTLITTSRTLLPRPLVVPFVTEISVLYYGLVAWKTPQLPKNAFTYHKGSSSLALWGTFILLVIAETFVFHILIMQWSEIAAWVLSALSVYTALQCFGFAKSLARRPIQITTDTLSLRYGIIAEANIPLASIEAVELTTRDITGTLKAKTLSPISSLEGHNVVLSLKSPQVLRGLYGIKNEVTTIAFHIDRPEEFKSAVEAAMT